MALSSVAVRPLAVKRPGAIAVAWEIFKKDLLIERRTGEIVATAGVFSIVIGFLASMAFHVDDKTNAAIAAGTIWVTGFFAAGVSLWPRGGRAGGGPPPPRPPGGPRPRPA